MQLTLVRHAEPECGGTAEPHDPDLSPAGLTQARLVADRLAAWGWDALYSSPRRRALHTAEVIAARLGLSVRIEAGLDEPAPDADAATVRAGAVAGIEAVIARHPGELVVAVTHGPVLTGYVGHLYRAPCPIVHHPDYTGITEILASSSGRRELRGLNHSVHLRLAGANVTREEL